MVDEVIDADIRERVYNQTRATVIALYKRLRRHIANDIIPDEKAIEEELLEDEDVFHIANEEDDDTMSEEILYVVKKSLIIDEWKKRCFLAERKRRLNAKSVFKLNSLKNRLEQAFTKTFEREKKEQLSIKRSTVIQRTDVVKRQREIQTQLKSVFLDSVKKGNSAVADEPKRKKKSNADEVDMSDFKIPETEILLVDQFLTKFTIVSESSLNEHLDIMLMIKALPNKVTQVTIEQTEMFNFRVF